MEYFVISAKFVPLKYYTLSSQLRRLTSFSVGLFGSANSVTRSYPVMRKIVYKPTSLTNKRINFSKCMIQGIQASQFPKTQVDYFVQDEKNVQGRNKKLRSNVSINALVIIIHFL